MLSNQKFADRFGLDVARVNAACRIAYARAYNHENNDSGYYRLRKAHGQLAKCRAGRALTRGTDVYTAAEAGIAYAFADDERAWRLARTLKYMGRGKR